MMKTSSYHSERGGVMIYILLAIALMAALSFFVSRGSRTNAGFISDEQAKVAAQEIVDYTNAVAATVQKLRLRGCADTQLNFGNTAWVTNSGTAIYTDLHNPSAPASGCSVFSMTDGAIQAAKTADYAMDGFLPTDPTGTSRGSNRIIKARTPQVGDNDELDLILRMPHLKREVCIQINNLLGIENVDGEPPVVTGTGSTNDYDGTFSVGATFNNADGTISGKTSFCASGMDDPPHDGGWYVYIQVLIAR